MKQADNYHTEKTMTMNDGCTKASPASPLEDMTKRAHRILESLDGINDRNERNHMILCEMETGPSPKDPCDTAEAATPSHLGPLLHAILERVERAEKLSLSTAHFLGGD